MLAHLKSLKTLYHYLFDKKHYTEENTMDNNPSASVGSLKVSNEAIVKIAELAAAEISGVVAEDGKLVVNQSRVALPTLLNSPVKVSISKEAAVIDLSIITEQGQKAINVASAVQENVKSAVQSMTGIPVSKVNVKVVGIKLNK